MSQPSEGLSTAEIKEKLKSIGLPCSGSREKLAQQFDDFFGGTTLAQKAPAAPAPEPEPMDMKVEGFVEKYERKMQRLEEREAKAEAKAAKDEEKRLKKEAKDKEKADKAGSPNSKTGSPRSRPGSPKSKPGSPSSKKRRLEESEDTMDPKDEKKDDLKDEALKEEKPIPVPPPDPRARARSGIPQTPPPGSGIPSTPPPAAMKTDGESSSTKADPMKEDPMKADPMKEEKTSSFWDGGDNADATPAASSSGGRGEVFNAVYKTTLCAVFKWNGKCSKGESCAFAHGLEELRRPEHDDDVKTIDVSSGQDETRNREDSRASSAPQEQRHEPRQQLCRSFEERGFCQKHQRGQCPRIHGAWNIPFADVEDNDMTATISGPDYGEHPMVQYLMDENVDPNIKKVCTKQLMTNCAEATQEDIGAKKTADVTSTKLIELKKQFDNALEVPLKKFAGHLRPSLFRRVHVGTMDFKDESPEAYRKTVDFLETFNTWYDTDRHGRKMSDQLRNSGCSYKEPKVYDELAKRAQDGFQLVIKVSCVATHIKKADEPYEWWPKLYWDKYSKLKGATVAFLWQFPPQFRNDEEGKNLKRLEKLADYLEDSDSMAQGCRHIVDFRHESWYTTNVYEFLKIKRWCLAWLHLNNEDLWASHIPTGWTDRVQTTDFVYMRLFGPDGKTHGSYDREFLHKVFESCPVGATSYVNFCNREYLNEPKPNPRPAFTNAFDFRAISSKMDMVTRIGDVRSKGDCPRLLDKDEQLLLNSFYLRFATKARTQGISIGTPCATAPASKYYARAAVEKRCFEWLTDVSSNKRLHFSLNDINEEGDVWRFLRQIQGLEDMNVARRLAVNAANTSMLTRSDGTAGIEGEWYKDGELKATVTGSLVTFAPEGSTAMVTPGWEESEWLLKWKKSDREMIAVLRKDGWLEWKNGSLWNRKVQRIGDAGARAVATLRDVEKQLINGAFIRWSQKAREAGLLATTEIGGIEHEEDFQDGDMHCNVSWVFKRRTTSTAGSLRATSLKDEKVTLSTRDLVKTDDIMTVFKMLSRMSDQTVKAAEIKRIDIWKDTSWKKMVGEMFKRGWTPTLQPQFMRKLRTEEPKETTKDGESLSAPSDEVKKERKPDMGDSPPPKKKMKLYEQKLVWAEYPADGVWHKAYVEQVNWDDTLRVRWANGNPAHRNLKGWEKVADLDMYPEDKDGRPMCPTCRNTGKDEYGAFCLRCDKGNLMQEEYVKNLNATRQREIDEAVWVRVPMLTGGGYIYKNQETGVLTLDLPPMLQDIWERKVAEGAANVYYNLHTGRVVHEPPPIEYEDEHGNKTDAIQERVKHLLKKNQQGVLTVNEEKEVDALTLLIESGLTKGK